MSDHEQPYRVTRDELEMTLPERSYPTYYRRHVGHAARDLGRGEAGASRSCRASHLSRSDRRWANELLVSRFERNVMKDEDFTETRNENAACCRVRPTVGRKQRGIEPSTLPCKRPKEIPLFSRRPKSPDAHSQCNRGGNKRSRTCRDRRTKRGSARDPAASRTVAPTDSTFLLPGELRTGKEFIARTIPKRSLPSSDQVAIGR
jgi:hypothetical protein